MIERITKIARGKLERIKRSLNSISVPTYEELYGNFPHTERCYGKPQLRIFEEDILETSDRFSPMDPGFTIRHVYFLRCNTCRVRREFNPEE